MSIEILLEAEASPDEVAAVERALQEAGIEAPVKAAFERRGVGLYPWILSISVPAVSLFLKGFLEQAGRDAAVGLKTFVIKLYEARRNSKLLEGGVTLTDEATGEWVMLREDLPDKAWRLLFTIEIAKTKSGQLRWDFKGEVWRDTLEIED